MAWKPHDEGLLRDTPPSVEPARGTGEPTDGQPPEGGASSRGNSPFPAASQMGIMARRSVLAGRRARTHLPRSVWHFSQPPASKRPCQEGLSALRGPSLLPVKWGLGGPHPSSLNKDSVAGGVADGVAANQMCCQG